METSKKMERYEEIKLTIKELTEEAQKLAPAIQEMLEGRREGQARTERGKFFLAYRTTWTYSDAVTKKEKTLKDLKKKEEKNKIAVGVEKKTLTYRQNNPED